MEYLPSSIPMILSFLVLSLLCRSSSSSTFTITNNCPHAIWPGTLAGSGTPQLPTTGFKLDPGRSVQLPAPSGWSGRIWARTDCDFSAKGAGACQTGDCGGKLECSGMGALPPATLFEITLGKGRDQDFYDVSLVDGYNLPIYAVPRGTAGVCSATGCATDLNSSCPKELQVMGDVGVVACKSACEGFGLDQYCCRGQFGNPSTCKPSFYSTIFKAACPRAYSYAFDDGTSTFTCKASDYAIVFCPNIKGVRRSDGDSVGQPTATGGGAGVGVSTGQPTGSSTGQPSGGGVGVGVSPGLPTGSSTGQSTGAGVGVSTGQPTGSSTGQPTGGGVGVSTGQPTGSSTGQSTGAGAGAGIGVSTGQPTGSSTGQPTAGGGGGGVVSTGQPTGSFRQGQPSGAGIYTGQPAGSSYTGAGVSTGQPSTAAGYSSIGTQPNYWQGSEGGAQEISSGSFLLFELSFTISTILYVASVVI